MWGSAARAAAPWGSGAGAPDSIFAGRRVYASRGPVRPSEAGRVGSTLSELLRWAAPWYRYRRRLRRRHRRPAHLATIAAIDGMLSNEECALLYELARAAQGGCIVEIGAFHGKGTIALGLGARDGARVPVYSVDPFLPYTGPLGRHRIGPGDKTALLRNLLLADVTEQVWLIHTHSAEAAAGWQGPVALLVVDGDHSYDGVAGDLGCWGRFVVPGGLVALDDSLDERFGVARLIRELLAAAEYERVRTAGKITVLRKRGAPHCT